MEKKFIMTASGKDRPGFVADVTQIVYEHGCNIEDATMSKLEDEFTMILMCIGQGEDVEDQLSRACRRLEREKGITAFLRPIKGGQDSRKKTVMLHTVHVEGIDHAGIVYKISKFLGEQQINIADLQSRLSHTPGTGTGIYTIEMHVEVPAGTAMDALRQGLNQIGDDLQVDVVIK